MKENFEDVETKTPKLRTKSFHSQEDYFSILQHI